MKALWRWWIERCLTLWRGGGSSWEVALPRWKEHVKQHQRSRGQGSMEKPMRGSRRWWQISRKTTAGWSDLDGEVGVGSQGDAGRGLTGILTVMLEGWDLDDDVGRERATVDKEDQVKIEGRRWRRCLCSGRKSLDDDRPGLVEELSANSCYDLLGLWVAEKMKKRRGNSRSGDIWIG